MSELPHTPEPHEVPDAWHAHTAEEGAPQAEHGARANPVALGVTLLAIVFSFVFLLLIVWGYFTSYTTQMKAEHRETVTEPQRIDYMTARSGAQTRLSQAPGWIDRENGTVHIPLDRATNLILEEYQRVGMNPNAQTDQEVAASDG
ncbi:MAG: hypothetical protein DHS20C14_12970 [Phycisphaeraceae bacterium]|nr:MAG: hypothetical protein DHS20C14_12970 [Phycisphaeraceae bacterium]